MRVISILCEAVLFDLDGVLIDSAAAIRRHWTRWAVRHGLDAEAVMRVAHGRRSVDTIRLVAPHLDAVAEADRLVEAAAPDTEGLLRIEGAAELVQSLPADRWAVATSGMKATATTRLVYAGLPVPPVLVTAEEVAHGKPNPEAYLLAAARLGAAPGRCVVVEDAPAGIGAARAAGMRVVAVATTHTPEELAGADVVAARLTDVSADLAEDAAGASVGTIRLTVRGVPGT